MLFESKKKRKKSESEHIKVQAALSASVMSTGSSDADNNSTFLSSQKLGSVLLNK